MAGRKSLKDELTVLRRFEDLAPSVFAFVQKMFSSELKEDQKWAADWIKTGYVKMIPQKLQGDPDHPFHIKTIIINKNGSGNQPSTKADGSMGSV